MTTITKIGERATCATCNKAIVYGSAGWLHWRQPAKPHPVAVGQTDGIIDDSFVKALERIGELEEMLQVRDARIQTLLEANRELSEKVRK